MSVYKVERKVDTIIIEMDISNAEALLEVTSTVEDLALMNPIADIANALRSSGEIREPSPLYRFDTYGSALVNKTREEYEQDYFNFHGTMDECASCGGKMSRHYFDCERVR